MSEECEKYENAGMVEYILQVGETFHHRYITCIVPARLFSSVVAGTTTYMHFIS